MGLARRGEELRGSSGAVGVFLREYPGTRSVIKNQQHLGGQVRITYSSRMSELCFLDTSWQFSSL